MTYQEILQWAREAKTTDESHPITAVGLMAVRENVAKWNLPADHFVISGSLKERFFSEAWFIRAVEPAHKYEDVQEGFFGTLYGMKIVVDLKRLMEPNTVAILSVQGRTLNVPIERCIHKCRMA